jgi:DNA-binding LacI/PurR family transcriptional regulator
MKKTSIETPHRLEDLAELAGVSVATVSRALNDSPLVSDRTKKMIFKLAQAHNYAGRMPAPLKSVAAEKTISMIIPPPQGRDTRLSDPFILDLIGGIGDALKERNVDLLISHITLTDMQSAADLVGSGRCDGLIILGQSTLHDQLNSLAGRGIPFVAWGAQMDDQLYCSVGSDNFQGGKRATGHLIRMGRKRIVFLGDTAGLESQQRFDGYLAALQENDVDFDPALVLPAHFFPESAMEAVDVLLEQGASFDGLVAASDMIAIGAMRALANAGKRVPEDVSVIGYDDVLVAGYASPALTTVRQDVVRAGRLVVSKLLRLLDGETVQSSRLPTELIVRESCGS